MPNQRNSLSNHLGWNQLTTIQTQSILASIVENSTRISSTKTIKTFTSIMSARCLYCANANRPLKLMDTRATYCQSVKIVNIIKDVQGVRKQYIRGILGPTSRQRNAILPSRYRRQVGAHCATWI